jgi:nitrate/nitrite transporter NarK
MCVPVCLSASVCPSASVCMYVCQCMMISVLQLELKLERVSPSCKGQFAGRVIFMVFCNLGKEKLYRLILVLHVTRSVRYVSLMYVCMYVCQCMMISVLQLELKLERVSPSCKGQFAGRVIFMVFCNLGKEKLYRLILVLHVTRSVRYVSLMYVCMYIHTFIVAPLPY